MKALICVVLCAFLVAANNPATPHISERVVVVTGAARGIGREVFLQLAQEGYGGIVAIDQTAESCRETIMSARDIFENSVYNSTAKFAAYGANVANFIEVERVAGRIMSEFGRVDVLINNAGITRDHLIVQMTDEEWNVVIRTNLNSVFYVIKNFLTGMIKQRWGRIINVSSVVGLKGNAGQTNYAASKGAIIGFSKSLAKELAPRNIQVNAIAPGFVKSPMTSKMTEAALSATLNRNPLKRLGDVSEIASVIRFLASDKASYISGSVVSVDGSQII